MYTLYGYPYSQHSRRVVSLLEELGLTYTFKLVDMMKGEYLSDEYMAINPNHQVPTLVDGEIILHESNAILRYLCKKHSRYDWYPQDPKSLAFTEQWLDWNQCQFSQVVVNIVLNKVFLGEKGDMHAADTALQALPKLFSLLDKHLTTSAFLSGTQPGIADLSVASNLFQLTLAKVFPQGEALCAWYDKIANLKGFAASLPQQ